MVSVYDISGEALRIDFGEKEMHELFETVKSTEPSFEKGPLTNSMVKEFLKGLLHKDPNL